MAGASEQQTKMNKKAMIAAMGSTMCNVAASCEKVGVSRRTYYNWTNGDPEFKQAIDDLLEKNLDFAESMLLSNIKNKKEASIFFYLKTKGKKRGYIETTHNVNVNKQGLAGYTDEELEDIIAEDEKGSK